MIEIKEVTLQFRSPVIGQITRSVKEHYNGRSIKYTVDGGKMEFVRFLKDELPFESYEEDFIIAIQAKIDAEAKEEQEVKEIK